MRKGFHFGGIGCGWGETLRVWGWDWDEVSGDMVVKKVNCATLLLGIGGVLISLSKAMSP